MYGPVSISANSPRLTKPTQAVSLVDAFNSMQVEKRRCGSSRGSSSYLLPVDLRRRSCSCIPRSLTRAGPRLAPSSATCGTHPMMLSSSIALVRSPLCATIFIEGPSSREGQDWDCCCSAPSCASLATVPSRLQLDKFPSACRCFDRGNFSRLCTNLYRSCPNTSPNFVTPRA